jgi:hypothetical protein
MIATLDLTASEEVQQVQEVFAQLDIIVSRKKTKLMHSNAQLDHSALQDTIRQNNVPLDSITPTRFERVARYVRQVILARQREC